MLKRSLLATALAVALAAPAFAADTAKQAGTRTGMVSAEDIKGAELDNANGDRLGKIDHVVIDQSTGQVRYVVFGSSGKDIAVPWKQLQPGTKSHSYQLNIDKQALDSAPSVDTKNWQALSDQQTEQRISAFWQNAATQQAQMPHSTQKNR